MHCVPPRRCWRPVGGAEGTAGGGSVWEGAGKGLSVGRDVKDGSHGKDKRKS